MLRWTGRRFLSLLLTFFNLCFLAAVALWLRSFYVNDHVRCVTDDAHHEFLSTRGKWAYRMLYNDAMSAMRESDVVATLTLDHPKQMLLSRLSLSPAMPLPEHGFSLQRNLSPRRAFDPSGFPRGFTLALPAWLVTLVLAHFPAMQLYAAWKRRQRNRKKGGARKNRWFALLLHPLYRLSVNSSLFLLLALITLWIASYQSYYAIARACRSEGSEIYWSRAECVLGQFGWTSERQTMDSQVSPSDSELRFDVRKEPQPQSLIVPLFNSPQIDFHLGAFHLSSARVTVSRQLFLATPVWFLAILFAILPALDLLRTLRRDRQRKRRAAGFCAQCGYDLRATPDRCPECGSIPRWNRPGA